MNDRPKHDKAQLSQAGGGMLALYFRACLEAETAGRPFPAPEDIFLSRGVGQGVKPAYDLLRDLIGVCDCPMHRQALRSVMAGFADIIAAHGAELEGMLHHVMNPDEPDTFAYVVRVRAPDLEETDANGF
jgi:hypothetical protein